MSETVRNMVADDSPSIILRYIRCNLAGETFALDMNDVYSVQRDDGLRRNLDSHLPAGWYPTPQGEAPVYHLADLLGMPVRAQAARQRVILMRPIGESARMWGLLVDQVSEISSVSRKALVALPRMQAQNKRYLASAISLGDELIPLIDPSRLSPPQPGSTVAEPVDHLLEDSPAAPSHPNPRETPEKATRANQLILFSLAGVDLPFHFALSAAQVVEILEPLSILPVPGSPQWILGYVKWRNRAVPLVDLYCRFGLPGRYDLRRSRLMILRVTTRGRRESVFGILVKPTIRIQRLPVRYRECINVPSIPSFMIKGAIEIDQRIAVIPDLQKVFQLEQ